MTKKMEVNVPVNVQVVVYEIKHKYCELNIK